MVVIGLRHADEEAHTLAAEPRMAVLDRRRKAGGDGEVDFLRTGLRAVLGGDIGPSEDAACWRQCLRGLVARGCGGVRRVMSAAHQGRKQAITAALNGASGHRGRGPCLRNALAVVPKQAGELVAAARRTVFAAPEPQAARRRWRQRADGFGERYPRLATLLDEAAAAVLA